MPVTWYDACWEKAAGWVWYRTQSQWDGKTKSQLVLGVISLQQWRLSTPDLDHTPRVPFIIPPGLLLHLRTEEDRVSSLPLCLCRSWLQMCLCRRSLDLRRAVVGAHVRTAQAAASSWTTKSVTCARQVFRSPLYISLFGMTWKRCQSLVCGRCCPTLTCHISSVEPVCAGPKGNLQSRLKFHSFLSPVCQLRCFMRPIRKKPLGVSFLPIVYYLLCESGGNWIFVIEAASCSWHPYFIPINSLLESENTVSLHFHEVVLYVFNNLLLQRYWMSLWYCCRAHIAHTADIFNPYSDLFLSAE